MAKSFEKVLAEARNLSTEDQQRLIEELAAAADGGKGQIRTVYDALKARGLIGFMTDAPEDLSSNPKYMEGFGQNAQ